MTIIRKLVFAATLAAPAVVLVIETAGRRWG